MKVSVVIPAHNEEEFIERTLRAVMKQDYSNYEIIVVNNASTDRTAEIVSRFPQIKLVYEAHRGLLWARESGRKHATGDVIANLDADCEPASDWISKAVRHFTKPDIIGVTGPYLYFDAHPRFIKFSLRFQRWVYAPISRILQSFKNGAVVIGGNNFIRADALMKIGGYDTSILFYGEDTDTAKRLSRIGKIKFVNDLTMNTSARRFMTEGMISTFFLYIFNFFWFTFFRNPERRLRMRAKELFSQRLK
jgi:glycosyltransferase involved in cell wall biosynthesis